MGGLLNQGQMPEARYTYVVSLRAILIAIVVVMLLGAFGGGVVAWTLVQRAIASLPAPSQQNSGSGETISRDPGAVFARIVQEKRPGVLSLLDGRGNAVQGGVALTADGVGISVLPDDRVFPRQALTADGRRLPIAFVREYPEHDLFVFRVSGEFPAPQFTSRGDLRAGLDGLALAVRSDAHDVTALPVALSALVPPSTDLLRRAPGHGPVARLATELPASMRGASVWGSDGRLLGLVTGDREGTALVLASDLDAVLQDLLRHPGSANVSVLSNLRLTWLSRTETRERGFPGSTAFRVDVLPTWAKGTELAEGDIVTTIDDAPVATDVNPGLLLLKAARERAALSFGLVGTRGPKTVVLQPVLAADPDASPVPSPAL